jgi:hypothetical protein
VWRASETMYGILRRFCKKAIKALYMPRMETLNWCWIGNVEGVRYYFGSKVLVKN